MPATTLFGEYVQNLPRLSTELEEFDPAAATMEALADWDELARLALAGEIAELTRLAEVQHVSQLDAKVAHLATCPSLDRGQQQRLGLVAEGLYPDPRWHYRAPTAPHHEYVQTAETPNVAAAVMSWAIKERRIDFSYMVVPEAERDVEMLEIGDTDSFAAVPMVDESVLIYDYTIDSHMAWSSWYAACGGLADNRAANAELARRRGALGPRGCFAYLARTHLEGGRLLPRYLPARLDDERMVNIADVVDEGMKPEVRRRFLLLRLFPFRDLSVLVWDPHLGEWGSAYDGDMCTRMLRAGYAPGRLSRQERKLLRD